MLVGGIYNEEKSQLKIQNCVVALVMNENILIHDN